MRSGAVRAQRAARTEPRRAARSAGTPGQCALRVPRGHRPAGTCQRAFPSSLGLCALLGSLPFTITSSTCSLQGSPFLRHPTAPTPCHSDPQAQTLPDPQAGKQAGWRALPSSQSAAHGPRNGDPDDHLLPERFGAPRCAKFAARTAAPKAPVSDPPGAPGLQVAVGRAGDGRGHFAPLGFQAGLPPPGDWTAIESHLQTDRMESGWQQRDSKANSVEREREREKEGEKESARSPIETLAPRKKFAWLRWHYLGHG